MIKDWVKHRKKYKLVSNKIFKNIFIQVLLGFPLIDRYIWSVSYPCLIVLLTFPSVLIIRT